MFNGIINSKLQRFENLRFFAVFRAMHKRGLCRHAVSVCLSVCHVRTFCRNE